MIRAYCISLYVIANLAALPVIAWRGFSRGFRAAKGLHGRR